jgi:hypothetical protein
VSDPREQFSVCGAYDDLLQRTLGGIPCELARLIYLASTRDYNSGTYHHEGLSTRYRRQDARTALERAHRESFYRLASMPLADLVEELNSYMQASREDAGGFIRTWQELEPYRVAVPMEVESTNAKLFLSNIRIALEVLRWRHQQGQAVPPQAALPQLSPGR